MRRYPISWIKEGNCIRCTSHKVDNWGYANVTNNRKKVKICRIILFRKHGEQPKSVVCRHTCDNPWCINPDHIIPGSVADNNRDRSERGRSNPLKGEQSPLSRLKTEDVIQIRAASGTLLEIANRFGISFQHVSDIKLRKKWKHV